MMEGKIRQQFLVGNKKLTMNIFSLSLSGGFPQTKKKLTIFFPIIK